MNWLTRLKNSWQRLSQPLPITKSASTPSSGACPECGRRLKLHLKEDPRAVESLVTLTCPTCEKTWGPYRI